METILLLKELEKYSVFNIKKISEIIGKTRSYGKLVAYRLKKKNYIIEIEKNKFTLNKDPLVAASRVVWPSYISLWTALRYYNLTEQLPQNVFVITSKKRKKKVIEIGNIKLIYISINPKLFFGYKKEIYNGYEIFMAEKEKALIDSVLLRKISFSEIASMVKDNMGEIDTEVFLAYLVKIRNKTLAKRFGLLFEKLGIDFYSKLKKILDYKYVKLDYALPKKGKKNKKWRIIENAEI